MFRGFFRPSVVLALSLALSVAGISPAPRMRPVSLPDTAPPQAGLSAAAWDKIVRQVHAASNSVVDAAGMISPFGVDPLVANQTTKLVAPDGSADDRFGGLWR